MYYDKGQWTTYPVQPIRTHSKISYPKDDDLTLLSAVEFATTTRSQLPIIAVDLPAALLSGLASDHAWLTEDEAWRGVLTVVPGPDRRYAEIVRDAVRSRGGDAPIGAGGGGKGWVWLFSVRETRVSCLLQEQPPR